MITGCWHFFDVRKKHHAKQLSREIRLQSTRAAIYGLRFFSTEGLKADKRKIDTLDNMQ